MPLEVTSFDMIAVQRPWRTKAEEGEARSDAVGTSADAGAGAERVRRGFRTEERRASGSALCQAYSDVWVFAARRP